jgi:uncharacterized protein YxjI
MRYAMASKWWPERFTISDDAGRAQSEVFNIPGFAIKLSISVAGGEEIATIRRRRGGFQVIVRGQEAGLVRRRAADRYDIRSATGPLAAAGNVADGRYAITDDGLVRATVSRHLADHARPTQTVTVDISDEDDAAVLLATMLAIEAVQYERGGSQLNPRALLDLHATAAHIRPQLQRYRRDADSHESVRWLAWLTARRRLRTRQQCSRLSCAPSSRSVRHGRD